MSNICAIELLTTASFSVIYVGLIRLCSWNCLNRNQPLTIIRRSIGALITCVISCWISFHWKPDNVSALNYFGIKFQGFVQSLVLPLICTSILFTGSIVLHFMDGSMSFSIDLKQWRKIMSDICFWRNNLIAPVTEEWVFRSCTMPILLSCLSYGSSIFVGPLFFSLAHYHHVLEQRQHGYTWNEAILSCSFQAFYTYLFGVYASFIFIRTGHLTSVILCHSFCNYMGFPPFDEVARLKNFRKIFTVFSYFFGLSMWIYLLYPLSEPGLYESNFTF